MRIKKVLARVAGVIYILVGVVNLSALFMPQIREEIISLGAVIFRYSGFIVVGIGLLTLQKWSAYFWGLWMLINLVLVYTVYEGKTMELNGFLAILPWIGPILIIAFYFYIWSILKPASSSDRKNA